MNDKIVTRRRNTFIVTFASHVDPAVTNAKSAFDMTRVCEPTPNGNDPIWTLHFDTGSELNQLKEFQKEVNKEKKDFQREMASIASNMNDQNEDAVPSTQETSEEAKKED